MDKSVGTLNTAEAARRAGVSGDTVRRWIRIGLMPNVFRVGPGRRYRIDELDLAAVIEGYLPVIPDAPTRLVGSNDDKSARARRGTKRAGS